MNRKIVLIDKEACIGCGMCVDACHEGAIKLEDGKATLISEEYCDGLGDCLPLCPVDAIKITVKESLEYNEKKVKLNNVHKSKLEPKIINWPIQIKLAPVLKEYYDRAHLLIAATCTAFSYQDFYQSFMHNRILLIGCPKLDNYDYSIKLRDIIENNNIFSIALVIMEVPCCKGLLKMVKSAIENSGKDINFSVRVLKTEGGILECY